MPESKPSQDPQKPVKRWRLPLSDDQIVTVRVEPRSGRPKLTGEDQDPWVSDLDNSGDPEVHDLDSSSDG